MLTHVQGSKIGTKAKVTGSVVRRAGEEQVGGCVGCGACSLGPLSLSYSYYSSEIRLVVFIRKSGQQQRRALGDGGTERRIEDFEYG
jgi:hypothetical protein